MSQEMVVLVDEHDNVVGEMEKMEAHEKGLLHRAFSVFVFNSRRELLIHQRAFGKYHSGGLWTNTCCSHPRIDEPIVDAAHRRLIEEMGFDCPIKKIFSFTYRAEFSDGLIEHELDHVFIGFFRNNPEVNPEEVAGFKWISFDALEKDLEKNPGNYTAWFKLLFPKINEYFSKKGWKILRELENVN